MKKIDVAVFVLALAQVALTTLYFLSIVPNGPVSGDIRKLNPKYVNYEGNAGIVDWAESCKSPCILPDEFKMGGNVVYFNDAANMIFNQHKNLVIATDVCISSCTILIDMFEFKGGKFCIDEHTLMGYHYGQNMKNGVSTGTFMYKYANPQINNWFEFVYPLNPDGSVKFFDSTMWGQLYPICHKDFRRAMRTPAMEDGKNPLATPKL